MINVTIYVAKSTLSKLIERACAGEEVIISRGDHPVVRLVSVTSSAPKRSFGALKGTVKVPDSFFEPLLASELDHWK